MAFAVTVRLPVDFAANRGGNDTKSNEESLDRRLPSSTALAALDAVRAHRRGARAPER
jgi:hypothetical protein